MAARWLVAVDDSEWSRYAFNYTTTFMKPEDHMYLMNVAEEPAKVFVGYATAQLLESLRQVEDEKSRKILVHFGHKAKALGIKFTMMKGADNNAGALLCKAVENYKINTLVIGRRSMGGVERFFVGSTSKYVVENADCNVIVVKHPFGPPEEHGCKADIIKAEEHERIRRLAEESGPAEIHDTTREAVVHAEEAERQRRMAEQASMGKGTLDRFIHHYQFHDDIVKLRDEC